MSDELDPQVDVNETPTDSAPVESTPELSSDTSVESTPEVEWRGVRDYLPELGIANDQFADDEAALKHLVEQAKQYQQIAPYYQQVAPHWSEYQQWLAQRQQAQQPQPQQPPPQQSKKESFKWEPLPELDQAWLNMVARDPGTGQIVVKPEYRGVVSPDLPQKVQAYLQAKQDRESKLLNDPVGAIWGGMEERLQAMFEQRERQLAEKLHADFQARQYLRDNAQVLFQFDQNGRPLTDPTTGQPAMTPYGQAFSYYLSQAEQLGIAHPMAREQYARQLAQSHIAQIPQAQPAQPTQPAPQQRGNFLTNRIANRGGTEAASRGPRAVPQDDGLSIGDDIVQRLKRAGYTEDQINGNVPINGAT